MHRQHRRMALVQREGAHLAVGITGDVHQHRGPARALVQALDGRHRKHLPDGPCIGQGLEQRKIAEQAVGHLQARAGREVIQRFVVQHGREPLQQAPVERIGQRPLMQAAVPEAEQLVHVIAQARGIVQRLARIQFIQLRPRVPELLELHGRVIRGRAERFPAHAAGRIHRIDHQHRVMRGQRPAGLGHDVRMRQAGIVAHLLQRPDHVVGVFLQGIVHRGLGAGERAVVVHAQAAAHVHVFDGRAQPPELHVKPRRLVHRLLHPADARHLRADVKVQQPQRIEHARIPQARHGLDDLRRRKPELRAVPARILPLALARGRQLAPQSNQRPDIHASRRFQQQLQLAGLLDHDEHPPAQLAPQQRQLDELAILVAVADDQPLDILQHGQHRVQLRLRARLQPPAKLAAELDDFLHHLPLLVHLDRIDPEVVALVAGFLARNREAPGNLRHAPAQDVREAKQQRRVHAAPAQLVAQITQVDGEPAVRQRLDAPARVDPEEAASPAVHPVQARGVGHAPRPAHRAPPPSRRPTTAAPTESP